MNINTILKVKYIIKVFGKSTLERMAVPKRQEVRGMQKKMNNFLTRTSSNIITVFKSRGKKRPAYVNTLWEMTSVYSAIAE
jgi:hypothetical protein